MKEKILTIIILAFILVTIGCSNSDGGEVDVTENNGDDNKLNRIEAIVEEVDEDNYNLIVAGIGEENSLGDQAIIDISKAKITEEGEERRISDINEGDKIAIFINKVAMSYPAKASTKKVIILESKVAAEAKVFIREGQEEITIRSENIGISNLSLIGLEYNADKDILMEKNILKEKQNIDQGMKITWEVVYSEGIPSMKLVWKLENGDKGEYIISYDGKDGINENEKLVYPEKDNEDDNSKDDIGLKEIKLYFILFDETDEYLVEENHNIKNLEGIAKFTLENLRDINPKTENAINPIYKKAKINGISINDGIAKVDFSKEIENTNFGSGAEALQVKAIVNTLTQFPTIHGVIFTIDGEPDVEGWLSHIGNVDEPFKRDTSVIKGYKLD